MEKRNASELILNANGSVYHLNLHPEDIAETIITVGDPSRVEMVSRYFDALEFKGNKREFITHTGRIGRKRLTVISSGIGPDNIDIVLNELDILANIDLQSGLPKEQHTALQIIRLGTSGALHAYIPVDTLLLSEGAFGLDNLLHFYKYEPDQLATTMQQALLDHCQFPAVLQPYYFSADQKLVRQLGDGFMHGITLTAPGFYGPQGRQVHAPVRIPGLLDTVSAFRIKDKRITNIEMESAAIFGLSSILAHSAVSLNAILANRATGQFSTDSHQAVDHLIRSALEIIATWA